MICFITIKKSGIFECFLFSMLLVIAGACANEDKDIDISQIDLDFVDITAQDTDLLDPLGRYVLRNNFQIMSKEMPQEVFSLVMGYDSRMGKPDENTGSPNLPAVQVNWHMAAQFSNNWSSLNDLESCYVCSGFTTEVTCTERSDLDSIYSCLGYRLPTEAEWELAARSGTRSEFWTGHGDSFGGNYDLDECEGDEVLEDAQNDPSLSDFAWYCGNNDPEGAKEIGQLRPNGYGLYDVHGNVWEWVHSSKSDFPETTIDPVAEFGSEKVLRGGAFHNNPYDLRLSFRTTYAPTLRLSGYGFRIVRTLH